MPFLIPCKVSNRKTLFRSRGTLEWRVHRHHESTAPNFPSAFWSSLVAFALSILAQRIIAIRVSATQRGWSACTCIEYGEKMRLTRYLMNGRLFSLLINHAYTKVL